MAQFSYTAISRSGEQFAGEVEAASRAEVLEQISGRGHLAVDVRRAPLQTGSDGSGRFGLVRSRSWRRRLSKVQVTMLTRELAMLLKAGLSLDDALRLLAQNADTPRLAQVVTHLRAKIGDGMSFHAALQTLPELFPHTYVNMVSVAEASGTLETVLMRVANAREREQKLKSKIISAMVYPGFLVATALGVVVLMIGFVVPPFKNMIMTAGGPVPEDARFVIAASDWLTAHAWSLLAGTLGGIALIWQLAHQPPVQRAFVKVVLRTPLIGDLLRLSYTIRFCRALGTLLENGVELPECLRLAQGAVGDHAAQAIEKAREGLRKGEDFTKPLAESGLFFPVAINLLSIGMETGSIAPGALYLAEMFEEKLEQAVGRAFTIFEPVIIVLVSIFVTAIIMSIIGAVISVNDIII